MTLPVIVAPEAEQQIQFIDAWWRENREAAPNLFLQELTAAITHIRSAPEAGHRYRHRTRKRVRRVPLHATRNHVYYEVTREAIVILAVWGAIKKRGPSLGSP
jgi:plasmid stabilization system protein ParE